MRFDDEHAYDQQIYDIPTIQQHIVPEHQFKKLITELAKKHGNITGAYWLIDVVCALNPKEFSDARKHALKQLTLKIYTSYDDLPSKKQLCYVLHKTGMGASKIAQILNIHRTAVYYHLKQQEVVPTRCMLTYGEYNLMLDFMDCWKELCCMYEL